MNQLAIICVDDQREVLSSLLHDLGEFAETFSLIDCESADEAMEAIEEIDAEGAQIALIISDHVMPTKTGVQFLTELEADRRFHNTKKLLLTGLATHEDTITAINKARIDLYIAKPWDAPHLTAAVRILITQFVFDAGLDYQEYEGLLDVDVVLERLR